MRLASDRWRIAGDVAGLPRRVWRPIAITARQRGALGLVNERGAPIFLPAKGMGAVSTSRPKKLGRPPHYGVDRHYSRFLIVTVSGTTRPCAAPGAMATNCFR